MASIVAASMRRRQAPPDPSLNATLSPLHHGSDSGNGGKGQSLDSNGGHSGGDDSQDGSGGGKGGGDGGGNSDSGSGDSGSQNGHDAGDNDNDDGQDNGQDNGSGASMSYCGAAFKPLMPDPRQCIAVQENDGSLKYSAGWNLASWDPDGEKLTSHSTTTNSSSVTIDFIGTNIRVFGTVPPSNMSATPASAVYAINGTRAFELSLPTSARCIPNQQFFQSPTLPPGAHTLTITVITSGTPYILDYLWFCGPPASFADSSSAESKLSRERSSQRDAIIVGSVLGAVVFFLGVAALVWFCMRRRKAQRKLRELNIAPSSPVHSWLHWQSRSESGTQVEFTSTESIMRDNPTYSSSVDSKDLQSRALVFSMPITTAPLPPDSPDLPPGLTSRPRPLPDAPEGQIGLAPPPWTGRPS